MGLYFKMRLLNYLRLPYGFMLLYKFTLPPEMRLPHNMWLPHDLTHKIGFHKIGFNCHLRLPHNTRYLKET